MTRKQQRQKQHKLRKQNKKDVSTKTFSEFTPTTKTVHHNSRKLTKHDQLSFLYDYYPADFLANFCHNLSPSRAIYLLKTYYPVMCESDKPIKLDSDEFIAEDKLDIISLKSDQNNIFCDVSRFNLVGLLQKDYTPELDNFLFYYFAELLNYGESFLTGTSYSHLENRDVSKFQLLVKSLFSLVVTTCSVRVIDFCLKFATLKPSHLQKSLLNPNLEVPIYIHNKLGERSPVNVNFQGFIDDINVEDNKFFQRGKIVVKKIENEILNSNNSILDPDISSWQDYTFNKEENRLSFNNSFINFIIHVCSNNPEYEQIFFSEKHFVKDCNYDFLFIMYANLEQLKYILPRLPTSYDFRFYPIDFEALLYLLKTDIPRFQKEAFRFPFSCSSLILSFEQIEKIFETLQLDIASFEYNNFGDEVTEVYMDVQSFDEELDDDFITSMYFRFKRNTLTIFSNEHKLERYQTHIFKSVTEKYFPDNFYSKFNYLLNRDSSFRKENNEIIEYMYLKNRCFEKQVDKKFITDMLDETLGNFSYGILNPEQYVVDIREKFFVFRDDKLQYFKFIDLIIHLMSNLEYQEDFHFRDNVNALVRGLASTFCLKDVSSTVDIPCVLGLKEKKVDSENGTEKTEVVGKSDSEEKEEEEVTEKTDSDVKEKEEVTEKTDSDVKEKEEVTEKTISEKERKIIRTVTIDNGRKRFFTIVAETLFCFGYDEIYKMFFYPDLNSSHKKKFAVINRDKKYLEQYIETELLSPKKRREIEKYLAKYESYIEYHFTSDNSIPSLLNHEDITLENIKYILKKYPDEKYDSSCLLNLLSKTETDNKLLRLIQAKFNEKKISRYNNFTFAPLLKECFKISNIHYIKYLHSNVNELFNEHFQPDMLFFIQDIEDFKQIYDWTSHLFTTEQYLQEYLNNVDKRYYGGVRFSDDKIIDILDFLCSRTLKSSRRKIFREFLNKRLYIFNVDFRLHNFYLLKC